MRTTSAATATLLVMLFAGAARADWPDFPFVYAEGEASREIAPDRATIYFTVAVFDKDSAVAMSRLQAQVEAALAVVKAADIPESRIEGSDLSKEVERASQDDQELEILGYHLSRSFELDVRDLSRFSSLMADLMAVDNVMHIYSAFDIPNRESVEAELVREAGANARSKAENMARAMGVELDSVFSISDEPLGEFIPGFSVTYRRMAWDSPTPPDTIFIPEVVTVSGNVNVMFKLDVQ